jgi:hypothetical protein
MHAEMVWVLSCHKISLFEESTTEKENRSTENMSSAMQVDPIPEQSEIMVLHNWSSWLWYGLWNTFATSLKEDPSR